MSSLTFEHRLQHWIDRQAPYTNVLGMARSMVAFGLLLTLLLNPMSVFIPLGENGLPVSQLLNPMAPVNNYNFFLLLGVSQAWIMKGLAILVLLWVISGYYPQVSALFHWWVTISFIYISSAVDGGDHMGAIITLLFIPWCISDPRRNHWMASGNRPTRVGNVIGVMSVWLIRLQAAVIYLHAATGKFASVEWMDGTAVYYWFYHGFFGMPSAVEFVLRPLLTHGLTVTILTYGVLIFELILFVAIAMPIERRSKLLPFALAFHGMIILVHGIFSFFFSIGAILVVYLADTHRPLPWIQRFNRFLAPATAVPEKDRLHVGPLTESSPITE